jgi:cell division protein FtsL
MGMGAGILITDKTQNRFTVVTLLVLIMMCAMLLWIMWEGFETVDD